MSLRDPVKGSLNGQKDWRFPQTHTNWPNVPAKEDFLLECVYLEYPLVCHSFNLYEKHENEENVPLTDLSDADL